MVSSAFLNAKKNILIFTSETVQSSGPDGIITYYPPDCPTAQYYANEAVYSTFCPQGQYNSGTGGDNIVGDRTYSNIVGGASSNQNSSSGQNGGSSNETLLKISTVVGVVSTDMDLTSKTASYVDKTLPGMIGGSVKYFSTAGEIAGVAGWTISAVSIGSKIYHGEKISTAEGTGFGISTVLVGGAWIAAGTVAAPFVATGALIYGASELGSYIFTGNILEENIFGK